MLSDERAIQVVADEISSYTLSGPLDPVEVRADRHQTQVGLNLGAIVVRAGEQMIRGVECTEEQIPIALEPIAAKAEVLPGRGTKCDRTLDGLARECGL